MSQTKTVTIGTGVLGVSYPDGASEFSTPNTILFSYAVPTDAITETSITDLNPDAYWRFEDNLLDTSGNGHTLTLQAGGTNQYINRGQNKAFFGDGLTHYKAVGYKGVAQLPNGLSFSFWIKPDDSGGPDRHVISMGDITTIGATIRAQVNDRQLAGATNIHTLSLFFGNGAITVDQNLLADGLWHNVVVCVPAVANIEDVVIYIDGDEKIALSTDGGEPLAITATDDVAVGSYLVPGVGPWFGGIDELAVFSRCLTGEEVLNIYNKQKLNFTEEAANPQTDTLIWGGLPMSVTQFNNTAATSSDDVNYFYAIDVIRNTESGIVTSESDDPGVAKHATWNGNKIQISLIDNRYYLNVLYDGETEEPEGKITLQGIPQATGISNELILNDSGFLLSDIDNDPNTVELDLKYISLGGVPITVGKVGFKYYLIVKEVLEP